MPEGPECKITTDDLRSFVFTTENPRLESLKIIRPKTVKFASGDVSEKINNQKITEINNKGKLIYIRLDNGQNILITLGMTGSLQFLDKVESNDTSHISYILTFNTIEIAFVDVRPLGTIAYGDNKYFDDRLARIGMDILEYTPDDDLSDLLEYSNKKISRMKKEKNITNFLMDQSPLAGIGNYIKCEALYIANIMPTVTVQSLSQSDLLKLIKAAVTVANESYNNGGVSIKNYFHLNGSGGNYSRMLKVYGRKTDPYGQTVSKIKTSDDRTTWYVKN